MNKAKSLGARSHLSEQAADELRQMIREKKLQPGDKLPSESELVEIFGVGRSTVREAVKLLIAENVVAIERGKGTFITQTPGLGKDPLGLDYVDQKNLLRDLLETRLLVEPPAAALAAQRARPKDIEAMHDLLYNSPDSENIEQDALFHTLVAECTHNQVFKRILPIINESIREGFHETATVDGSQQRAIRSHKKIFEAIKNRDTVAARRETEEHILSTARDANLNITGGKTNEKIS